jgi:hypothetical protein
MLMEHEIVLLLLVGAALLVGARVVRALPSLSLATAVRPRRDRPRR